ncbi:MULTISPECIES: GNAT family N-acetyltransferase [unclassified Nocardioides]|uniref:GNAT family N-acetyltransferase n=1 Tax=unclassified Nocardioides TaxID=2615069 RepID=UPI00301446A1
MIALRPPSADLYDAWLACVRDFGDGPRDGSGDWQVPDFGPDPTTFAALLEITTAEADTSRELPEGHVHCDYFWVFADTEMIGFVAVRHALDNEFLRTLGGHVGYSVRPSYRRRGHATAALGLALDRARELGLERVLLTCDVDNVGSARTIESQGGVLEDVRQGKRRYWIAVR